MNHHQQVDLVLLDFRKAFDAMPHCRLLSKLSSYRIHNQTQTMLGPLMFLIHIDDIGEDLLSVLKLFTDDCILYCSKFVVIMCMRARHF